MGCLEVKSEKYQTRKSPAFHAKDCRGLTKKGKDGQYISKADAKGIYKWIKVIGTRKRKGKYYDTHDNGSKAFRVYIDNSNVAIYKGEYKEDDTIVFDEIVKELKVKEVFIGKPEGNSILLRLSENRYMHIGVEAYEFTMEDQVDSYFSMIGNSDVPYPVILGTENVYFMLDGDHKYVPRNMFPSNFKKDQWENAYYYYYGWLDPETGKSRTDKERKKENLEQYAKAMKGFKMIEKRRF